MHSSTKVWNTSIHIVDIKNLHNKIFCDLSERAITKTLETGQSVVIFLNKKGVHTGMVCKECGHIPYCKQCDIPISLHHNLHQQLFWLCPICQTSYEIIKTCPHCWHNKLDTYGIGIQHAAQYCKSQFTANTVIIQSSNANSNNKIKELLANTRNHPMIILATSLLQYPIIDNVWLVLFQNALQANIPDYNTEYNNYQFLQTVVKSYIVPHIIMQTYQPDHSIIHAITHDDSDYFLLQDQAFRQKHDYPPFGELCIISYKHTVESSLFTSVNNLFHDILALKQQWGYDQIQVYAIPAMIYKIYGKYRYQIVIKGKTIRSFTNSIFEKLKPYQKWFKFDRGAQSFF